MSRGMVVVTGATGFIGGELCARFRKGGRPVLGLVRRINGKALPDLQVLGDLRKTDEATLDEALGGAEAVVHLAGRTQIRKGRVGDPDLAYQESNADITAKVARAAARAGVKRFILASTVKVMGEESEPGDPYTPEDMPDPQDAYARSKLAAERALEDAAADSAMVPIVLRLPMVYGRHVRGNFARLVAAVLRGTRLPLGSVDNRRSVLYVRNLAGAIEAALDAAQPPEGVHFVTDERSISTPDLIRAIANAWQVPARLSRVPVSLIEMAAFVVGRRDSVRRLTRTLEVDASSFTKATGWHPQYTLERALARIAAHSRHPGGRGSTTTRVHDLPSRGT